MLVFIIGEYFYIVIGLDGCVFVGDLCMFDSFGFGLDDCVVLILCLSCIIEIVVN